MSNSDGHTNCLAGDWFALGCIFAGPYTFEDKTGGDPCSAKFGVNIGVQVLVAMDVASQYILFQRPIPKKPGAFNSTEVLGFLREVMERHGVPRIGVVLGESVWKSSRELMLNEETRARGQILEKLGIEIPAMPESEKQTIRARLELLKLRVCVGDEEFGESSVPVLNPSFN